MHITVMQHCGNPTPVQPETRGITVTGDPGAGELLLKFLNTKCKI